VIVAPPSLAGVQPLTLDEFVGDRSFHEPDVALQFVTGLVRSVSHGVERAGARSPKESVTPCAGSANTFGR